MDVGSTPRSSSASNWPFEPGEVTVSELSRELGISRSLLQRWKHLAHQATETAVASNEDVVPASELRTARELERALGRETMEVEILQRRATRSRTCCTRRAWCSRLQ